MAHGTIAQLRANNDSKITKQCEYMWCLSYTVLLTSVSRIWWLTQRMMQSEVNQNRRMDTTLT